MAGSRAQRIAVTAAIAVAGIVYLARIDSRAGATILDIARHLSVLGVGSALALGIVQNVLQATRLWILLPSDRQLPWRAAVRAFTAGQLINNYIPARAGDLAKIALMKEARARADRTETRAAEPSVLRLAGTVLLADKIADIGALLLLIALFTSISTAHILPFPALMRRHGWWLLPVVATFGGYGLTRPALVGVRNAVAEFSRGLRELTKPRSLILSCGTSTAAWLTEAVILIVLASSVGARLRVGEAIGVLAILNLGIAVPVSLANIGTFETAAAMGLIHAGLPTGEAIAVATVHHVVQLGSMAMLAFVCWWPFHQRDRANDFRVREIDKRRAIDHYASLSGDYDGNAGRGPLKFLRARERAAVQSFARWDTPSTRTMIDVGCGGGYYALAAKRAGLHVTVVDVVPEMVGALADKLDDGWCCDVENLSSEKTFDLVLCTGVLDFVLNPEIAFAHLAGLTAAGGRLVILAPRRGPFGFIYRLEKKLLRIDVNLFSRAWFEQQARSCGLVLADCVHPLPTNLVVLLLRPS